MQCRLCVENNPQLLWNGAEEENSIITTVRWYILQATGIQIEDTDKVPCVMCRTCIEVSINMCRFRQKAIKYDKLMQERFGQIYVPPLTRMEDHVEIPEEENLPSFVKVKKVCFENNINIETDPDDSECKVEEVEVVEHIVESDSEIIEIKDERPQSPEKVFLNETRILNTDQQEGLSDIPYIHSTVEELLVANPGLNIPEDIRNCHINPVIQLSPFEKPQCSKEFFTASLELVPSQNTNLNTGLVKVNKSDNIYMCNMCNQLFTTKKKLHLHKKMHFFCKSCNTSFPKRALLQEHIHEYHPEPANPLTYSITNSENMRLTLQKNGVCTNLNKHHKSSETIATPEVRAEIDYVKYLLVNRYMHKTQQETQTDYADLLQEPVTESNYIRFKGITKDLETSRIPITIKFGKLGVLAGKFVAAEDQSESNTPNFDFGHIIPTDVVAVRNESTIIDLVNSSPSSTNGNKSARRKRSRTKSCDSRTCNIQNIVVNCDSDSDTGNTETQLIKTLSSDEEPKKLRVKQLWEIN